MTLASTPRAGAGRFAPSPSGALHVGNLRTALLGWLFARSTGRDYLLRVEDLDRVAAGAAEIQQRDLAALGIGFDRTVIRQSERKALYNNAIRRLTDAGLTYECFCTRREIRDAASAPQADGRPAEGRYPGTCRALSDAERDRRRPARPPALRLRAQVDCLTVHDRLRGPFTGPVEDIVLRRNDGLAAYNLAVVVDDAAQGVDQVVRGDDLLPATPAQLHLANLLQQPVPQYAHVPLALNPAGRRLAKRDGAVTPADLHALGWSSTDVFRLIANSVGLMGDSPETLLPVFDPDALPAEPWVVNPAEFGSPTTLLPK